MKVSIYDVYDDPVKKIGEVHVVDGIVVPDDAVAPLLEDRFVPDEDLNPLDFTDGERYLKRLPYALSGVAIRAVLEEDDGTVIDLEDEGVTKAADDEEDDFPEDLI